MATFQAAAWHYLCQCTPGTPPPTPYPLPDPTRPTGWPDRPTYSCSDTDVCATLQQVLQRLDQLSNAVARTANRVDSLQRYNFPLSYIVGADHPGLTGSGTIPIERLAGVRLSVTSYPGGRVLVGTPPYQWDLGWCSVSDGGGLLLEHRISQLQTDWFPPHMPLASTFGYWLYPGVVVDMNQQDAEV